jgi:exodeoxyribonuclease-3
MRVFSINVNGLRSAGSKGLDAFLRQVLARDRPNIVCIQEVKAQWDDLPEPLRRLAGLEGHFHLAEKKGYSGVALYTDARPTDVITGFGSAEFDAEGRYVELRFDRGGQKLSLVSIYVPSGSSSPERQAAKFRFLAEFEPHLARLRAESGREVLLCGDVNIAHRPIDLKNWRANQKNSGFLPEERAWLDRLLGPAEAGGGWVDVFRTLNAEPEQYTWWSNRGQAWAKNVGWRIDYQLATPRLAASARREHIYKAERFSDHAPLIIEYDWSLPG